MQVIFSERASAELEIAVSWYEGKRKGLGVAFLLHVHAMVGRMAELPQSHAPIGYNCRRAVMGKFPYSIIYRNDATRIEIIALFPEKSNPDLLSARLHSPI